MKPRRRLSEDELLDGLRRRDEAAFSTLYDNHAPALYGIIVRIVRDEAEAENLMQDTFVKVWRSIDQYDASRGRLFTWLLNIARNTAISFLRSNQRLAPDQIQSLETVVSTEKQGEEPVDQDFIGVDAGVQQLDPKLKQMIDLVYFMGYTHQEVADQLQLPLGTVKTRTRTALQQLRRLLNVV